MHPQRDLSAKIKALRCGAGKSRTNVSSVADSNGSVSRRLRFQDKLSRHSQGLLENGAQALVALDQVGQRSL